MSTSYLTLTNNAINESGADLATFATSGSDWSTTTDSLRLKFKTWVARAWKEIQQDSFDLSFMEEQAVINIDPGIMFYPSGDTPVTFFDSLENTSVDIYDQDATVAINDIPFGTIYDLTGTTTSTKPFGYVNVVTTSDTPISWALKPGAEYFGRTASYTFTNDAAIHYASGLTGVVNNISTYTSNLSSLTPLLVYTVIGGTTYVFGLATFTSTDIEIFYSDAAVASALTASSPFASSFVFYDFVTGGIVASFTGYNGSPVPLSSAVTNTVTATEKAYIHSWKSFDFSEETGNDDFQENIKEINQKSFRIINYFQAPPQSEVPIDYVPWESFQPLYDLSGSAPGIPRVITRDNQNRFRLYPHPYQKMTLKFDYIRTPQILSAYTDIPKGIDDDIVDMIMWKALVMYGEYDEQPPMIARANKNFKNYQMRFDQKYRQKFHFKPKRLW